MFTCLKDGSRATTIGCANLRMKQGWGDDYIPSSLSSTCGTTSSSHFRRSPGTPSASHGGTGPAVPRRRSRRRCSGITGRCWGISEEPGSPCQPSSGSTTPEELCRFGDGC
jgi:hypothetical protein